MSIAESRRPGRPRSRPVEDERRLILEAALTEFAANGVDGASLDSIARAAGVHRPNIYEHFDNKAGLAASVFDLALGRLESVIVACLTADDSTSWRAIADSAFRALLRVAHEDADVLRLVWLLPRGRAHARQSVLDHLATLLDDRFPPDHKVNTAALAVMLYSMAEGVALRRAGEDWDDDELVELLATFTTGGITTLLGER